MDPTSERLDDALTARDHMVDLIAAQIRRQGYYIADVDPQPHQALVDLRWAAQMAGRQLGRPIRTHTTATGKRHPGKITVIVAPLDPPTVVEAGFGSPGPTRMKDHLDDRCAG